MPGMLIKDRDFAPLRRKLAEMVAARRLPAGLNLEAVEDVARNYDVLRQSSSGDERMAPSDAREWIEATIRKADELRARLDAMPEPVGDAMGHAAALRECPMDSDQAAIAALRNLAHALTMTQRWIEKLADGPGGRPRTHATWLVVGLTRVIEAAGAKPDPGVGVDPLWWAGCGLGLLGQAMAPPFIFQG